MQVTSEGEKAVTAEEGEEEGREAEASPSTNTRTRSQTGRGSSTVPRRVRTGQMPRGVSRPSPTPIVWSEQRTTRHQQGSCFVWRVLGVINSRNLKLSRRTWRREVRWDVGTWRPNTATSRGAIAGGEGGLKGRTAAFEQWQLYYYHHSM